MHLIAIAGDRSTTVSVRRNEGLLKAVTEHPNVVLDQLVYGDWRRAKAAEQAQILYARYPHAQLVWAGSDQMAFGAMDALKATKGRPGRDKLFSAINNSAEAMQALVDDQLTALSGGHFMTGAWALVMLYDYRHGHDFASEGLELDEPTFTLFRPEDVQRYRTRYGNGFSSVDFRRFSKALNPALKRYNFRFSQLLE